MKLYLDDVRDIPEGYVGARSSDEAIELIKKIGMPDFMSLDHDLGGEDTTMVFLKKLTELLPNERICDYTVHSSNPVGKKNIESYIDSWNRVVENVQ